MPITEIGSIYTPTLYGRTSFPLRHDKNPIFYKSFNPESGSTVNLGANVINIPNHFFKTGEPLKYQYDNEPIGISTDSPGAAGITTQFPSIVYPIVLDKDNIRISLGSTYAENNEYVGITSVGKGNFHTFETFKQNSKCLITINNIIQSPVSVASTVKVLSYTQSSITVENLKNIKIGSCIGIGSEIVKVSAVNYDTKVLNLSRSRDILGTDPVLFDPSLNNSYVNVLSGSYNIIKDIIYFDDPPIEGKTDIFRVSANDIVYSNYSFNILTNLLTTGTLVYALWQNPPNGIQNQKLYNIIKNNDNNFSFAETYADAILGNKIEFPNFSEDGLPVSDLRIIYFYPNEKNVFSGRVFLRSNYDGNQVFDDVSEQFTGITSSFELKSSGISTVGIKSDNGILLINNIFQYPGSDEAFSFVENAPKTFVNFVGFGTTGFTGKTYDVNVKGYPRGGIIVSYGTTSGSKYTPLTSYNNISLVGSATGIGASVSFDVDQYGNVNNFKFTNRGYNYKVGDILVPFGTSGIGTQVSNDKIHITVNETIKDQFSSWNIGILDKLDDLTSKVNGVRKTFSLTKNGQRISLDVDTIYEIDLQYNLLIFINDILQIPQISYKFKGGSLITFNEPIPSGSNVKVYFYKGYFGDVQTGSSISNVKPGDKVQLLQNIYGTPPIQQNSRIIKEFISADVLRTNIYDGVGISSNSGQSRSITWTPQKTDLIIDGEYVSKSRDDQSSGIGSFSIITTNFTVGVGTTIGITTTSGTFVGFCTNIIGINTNVGIGSLIQIGDYVEGSYITIGATIVSIGSSLINIGIPSTGVSTESGNLFLGITSYSSSPAGINTIPISFYRKS